MKKYCLTHQDAYLLYFLSYVLYYSLGCDAFHEPKNILFYDKQQQSHPCVLYNNLIFTFRQTISSL